MRLKQMFHAWVQGWGSLFNFWPHVEPPKFRRRTLEDDARNLTSDWEKVLGDLQRAVTRDPPDAPSECVPDEPSSPSDDP